MSRVIVLALFFALTPACNRGANVPRIFAPLARMGTADLNCPHVDQILYVAPRVVQVRGCGRRQEYVVDPSRRPTHAIPRIETVAAAELACARDSLEIASPAPAIRIVDGCQRRARYDLRCEGLDCGWRMTVHTGAWVGSEAAIPSQFDVQWELPAGVPQGPITAPDGYGDLLGVEVPTPPTAAPVIPPAP